jgi:hypothetical protein
MANFRVACKSIIERLHPTIAIAAFRRRRGNQIIAEIVAGVRWRAYDKKRTALL